MVDALAARLRSRSEPPADREVPVGPPGTLHPSLYLLQTDTYTFCGLCGVYGKQLRRCALHELRLREPKKRYARYYRGKLLSGYEPSGKTWRRCERPATPHDFD